MIYLFMRAQEVMATLAVGSFVYIFFSVCMKLKVVISLTSPVYLVQNLTSAYLLLNPHRELYIRFIIFEDCCHIISAYLWFL